MANSEYNYIPTYIRRTINNRPKDVVTAKYWNELFNLLITQGDHTAEELGNILNYFSTRLVGVESEIAESAEAIANIREVFRINVSYSNGVYSADKTFAEIKAAYDAGQQPYVVQTGGDAGIVYAFAMFTSQFVSFERYLIFGDTLKTVRLRIFPYTLENGSNIDRQTEAFDVASTGLPGAVRYDITQALSDTEKAQARANIGAGTSNFDGRYSSLTGKPTIPDISGKQDKLIAGEGITIAADGKTISSSGKVLSVNGKTGAVTLNAEDIIYAKESQKLDATIAGLKAADIQTASDISGLQTADASLDSRITAIETGDTPVTLYIYWESVVGTGRVSLTENGAAMSVADFISKMQSGAKIIIGKNNDGDSESSGFSNYRYKITDSTTASLAFDVANSFNGSNRTIIISGSSSTNGLMTGYQDIEHDDLSDYSPLPEGSTPASKAWVEDYVDTKLADGIIIPSSTVGSTKRFKLTVDDSGAITATEVTT